VTNVNKTAPIGQHLYRIISGFPAFSRPGSILEEPPASAKQTFFGVLDTDLFHQELLPEWSDRKVEVIPMPYTWQDVVGDDWVCAA